MIHERPHRPARWPLDALTELDLRRRGRASTRGRARARGRDPILHRAPSRAGRRRRVGDRHRRPAAAAASSPAPTRSRCCPATARSTRPPRRPSRPGPRRSRSSSSTASTTINRRDGYAAGDRALLIAARATQLAAARVGGTVYRDSGRRLTILVDGAPPSTIDVAAELHTEFAIGPRVRVGVAVQATRRERRDADHARPRNPATRRSSLPHGTDGHRTARIGVLNPTSGTPPWLKPVAWWAASGHELAVPGRAVRRARPARRAAAGRDARARGARGGRGASRPRRARRADRRLPAAAAGEHGRAAADRRRRLDGRGQVDAGQQPRGRAGQSRRASCARRRARRCSSAIPTICAGSRTTGSCPR